MSKIKNGFVYNIYGRMMDHIIFHNYHNPNECVYIYNECMHSEGVDYIGLYQ